MLKAKPNTYVRRIGQNDELVGPIGRVIRVEEYPEINESAVLVGWPEGAEWELGGTVASPRQYEGPTFYTVEREPVKPRSAYELGIRIPETVMVDAPRAVHSPEPYRGPEELRPDVEYLFQEDADAVDATWDARVRAFDEDAEREMLERAAERVELATQDVRVRQHPIIVLVDWERRTVEVRRSGEAARSQSYKSRDETYAAYRRIRAWAEANGEAAQYCRQKVAA